MPTKVRRGPVAAGRPARVFVDSGAWIGLVSADDQHHEEADLLFRGCLGARVSLVTTHLVLAEVHRLLLHRAGIRPAAAALARIEASPSVRIAFPAAPEHRAARAWLAKLGDQRITYTDAVSFSVMASDRCGAALSFDGDFVIAGFRRVRPDDAWLIGPSR